MGKDFILQPFQKLSFLMPKYQKEMSSLLLLGVQETYNIEFRHKQSSVNLFNL